MAKKMKRAQTATKPTADRVATRPRRVEASSKLRRALGAEARRLGTTPGQLAAALWMECLELEMLAARACLRGAA
jgi:hypothetical protein